MKTFLLLFVFFTLSVTPALAQKKVAVVKLMRGDVDILTLGQNLKLKVNDWVEEGAVVKTADKSFVKLVFVDKSQMNIGPNSEMKIENFSGKDSGVIDLVKGKIRSQVTKDYLQMEDKNKSKLFIKTANAVMGVRGTDFMITSNGRTSSVVLFEGEVVFNKLNGRNITDSRTLENIVDRGVRMFPGEFSVVEHNRTPTLPSLLNVQQRETLEKNDNFDASREPNNSDTSAKVEKSVVPAGLSGDVVSNDAKTLKTEVARIAEPPAHKGAAASANPEGFVRGDQVKPANGSYLHIESGLIIPPAPDSVLDKNSNTYVAGTGNGSVDKVGEWKPPKDVVVTEKGELFKKMEVPVVETKEGRVDPEKGELPKTEQKLVQIAKPEVVFKSGERTQVFNDPVRLPSGELGGPQTTTTQPPKLLDPMVNSGLRQMIPTRLPEQTVENSAPKPNTNTTIRVRNGTN